jgi:hypothetical protein
MYASLPFYPDVGNLLFLPPQLRRKGGLDPSVMEGEVSADVERLVHTNDNGKQWQVSWIHARLMTLLESMSRK